MKNRREFIKTTGLSALSIPLVAQVNLDSISELEPLKTGIIGWGSRGGGIARVLNNYSNIDVIAGCDVIPYKLDKLRKNPSLKVYENYLDLLENPEIEAVIIATPFSMHAEMAIDAIKAGKHVYCEKTLVKGLEPLQRLVETHKESNVIFQTGHQYNSSYLYQKVEQIVKSGYVGEVTSFECQWNRNGDWRRPVPDPKWEKLINWRMYREYSGGLVAELCSHQIDFICRVLGESPKKIAGFGGIDHWKDGRETFDNVHLLFEFPSGKDASFTCTTTNAFGDYSIKILGSKATIIMDYTTAKIYLEPNGLKEKGLVDGVSGATKKAWESGEGAPIETKSTDITLQALEQFYYSIREGKPVYADIESGSLTAKAVHLSLDALHNEKIAYWDDYPELSF